MSDDATPSAVSQLPSLSQQVDEADDAAQVYDSVKELLSDKAAEGMSSRFAAVLFARYVAPGMTLNAHF